VDDETRRELRELGLPDIIIDRWSQSQADLHLRFDSSPFDQRLVAQELAEIEEKRRIDEMVRLMTVKDEPPLSDVFEKTQPLPPAPVAQQAVEEVMPPDYDPPLRTPAAIITIEKEAPPPAPAALAITEEQPPLPLDRADPVDIEARNLQAALDLARAGIPVFPVRVYWKDGRWLKTPIIKGWQAVSADPERVRGWWRVHPEAVPGIPLGRPRLVLIDVDRHGGPDGVAAFDKLVAKHGGLPPGPVTATATSGGLHFIFKQPSDGKSLGNSEGSFAGRGMNVRGGHAGFVVAPGAVRRDGSMWRTADGSPSLIYAYQNGTIPVIPPWIVDMIRAPKPRKAPKEKSERSEAETTPGASPSSSKPSRSMDRRGKGWAETVLKKGAADLAAMPPHSGRNETANALGFQMGTTIARAWIPRDTVFNALWEACERNGLAVEEPERTRDTIGRAIAAGMLEPHPDLADGRSQAGRQRSGQHDDSWRNMLRSEVMWLQRIRPGGEYATLKSADDVLAKIGSTDGREIGRILDFKFSDYLEIGRRRGRCPSVLRPVDKTDDEIRVHRASIRNGPEKKAAKAEAEKARRLRKKQEKPPTDDLETLRCAAIIRFLEQHPRSAVNP